MELAALLPKLKQEESKERLVELAFLGFQMGAGGQQTFGEYLQSIGLSGEKVVTEKPITAEEAIAKAEKIRKAIRKKTP